MIRKTVLALAAVAALGAATLAPTAASAHHFGFRGPHFGLFFGGYDYTPDCYLVKQGTRYGYRYVQYCN